MPEMYREIEPLLERERCLDMLMCQAKGRVVDNISDEILIEQINTSHVGDNDKGNITACLIDGCDFRCLSNNADGVLKVINTDGTRLCEQPDTDHL